ncbi:MAG: type I phosphomannose isomerase catalytic subunit [Phycisphaerae bacterium]
MTVPPIPVVFEPIFKPKPWGGRELTRLFGKRLPGEGPIGESWELADLPGNESRVARGPLAGQRVGELIELWGRDFVGDAELVAGHFPLLIKFLDARQPLSVQVHPRGPAAAPGREQPGVKHEAWYVIDAAPGAVLYLGLRPGVGPDDVRAAGSTPALADLHQRRPGRPGCCYYLPSGVPHALGAGLVVAEVQTPSDVTYRLYDWERVGLDGRPRELHVDQALANIRYDVSEQQIAQPRVRSADALATVTRLVSCERFVIDKLHFRRGTAPGLEPSKMLVWIVLAGTGGLARDQYRCDFKAGDVVVIPADSARTRIEAAACELLEVKIPSRDSATG